MRKSLRHLYLEEISNYLKFSGLEFYDFHNPNSIGTSICEFSDPHHAGNTAYMRILRQILIDNPSSKLADHVSLENLEDLITENKGRKITLSDKQRHVMSERDFLEFECNKSY